VYISQRKEEKKTSEASYESLETTLEEIKMALL
jgi:hypothetical protein